MPANGVRKLYIESVEHINWVYTNFCDYFFNVLTQRGRTRFEITATVNFITNHRVTGNIIYIFIYFESECVSNVFTVEERNL